MFCPYCGTPCADTHKFCFRCGKPLPDPAVPETAEEVPVLSDPIAEGPAAVAAVPEEATEIPEETAETASPVTEETVSEAPDCIPEEAEQPVQTPPQPKKGRLWPPILALCLMICIGLSAFFLSGGGAAAEKSCFTVDNGVLYFDYSLYTGPDELTVPESVDGVMVTAVSDGCFRDCDRITTVILPETVTVIGNNAFTGCDALRGIYLPEGILSVGAEAFTECPELEAICFPASVMEIGERCLDNCGSLQYIFYDGTYAQWRELYDGTYRTGVELHTNDGVYYAQP